MDTLVYDERGMARTAMAGAVPSDFVPVHQCLQHSIERKLGYFRQARFVYFYYEPRGGEVVWNDGRSYGFGSGGWMMFLDEIAPLGRKQGVNLGSDDAAGDHVLVIDRELKQSWFALRDAAESLVDEQHAAFAAA